MTTTCGARVLSFGLQTAQDLPVTSMQAARGSDRQSRFPQQPTSLRAAAHILHCSQHRFPSGTLSSGPLVPEGLAGARDKGGSSLLTCPADHCPSAPPRTAVSSAPPQEPCSLPSRTAPTLLPPRTMSSPDIGITALALDAFQTCCWEEKSSTRASFSSLLCWQKDGLQQNNFSFLILCNPQADGSSDLYLITIGNCHNPV